MAGAVLGNSVAVFHDSSGVRTNEGLLVEFPDGLTEDQVICVVDNAPEGSVGRFNITEVLAGRIDPDEISTNPEYFNCWHASLPPIVLERICAITRARRILSKRVS